MQKTSPSVKQALFSFKFCPIPDSLFPSSCPELAFLPRELLATDSFRLLGNLLAAAHDPWRGEGGPPGVAASRSPMSECHSPKLFLTESLPS